MKWEKKSRSAGRKRITALQGGTSVRFSTGARFRGGSSTAIGIKTMRDRDDQTGSAVGNQRCAQTRSHAPLTTDNGQLTTGRKSLRLRYERVKPCVSIICGDLFAKSLILHMAQMGEGRSRAIATGASWRSRPSHEKQVPPLGLPPRQAQNRRPSGTPVSPRSGGQKESANVAKSEQRGAKWAGSTLLECTALTRAGTFAARPGG